jgi:transcriptional regulator with XRE-family HTH domain
MTFSLADSLKKRIQEKHLSAAKVERLAGLKQNAVRNIILGTSKQPSAFTLKAIANVLECTVDSLLEDEGSHISQNKKTITNVYIKDPELFIEASNAALQITKEKKINITVDQISDLIKEIYVYTTRKKTKTIDMDFVEWLVERL